MQSAQNIILLVLFFFGLSLKQHRFYTYSTSQFGPDTLFFMSLFELNWEVRSQMLSKPDNFQGLTRLDSTDLIQGLANYGPWPKSGQLSGFVCPSNKDCF